MKLDKSKPYGEIIGSTDGSKYDQGGNTFDRDGNQMNAIQNEEETVNIDEPKKRGRPAKQ